MTQTPERRFVDCFRLAARQAGSVARHLQGRVKTQKKSGQGSAEGEALTAVDLAAQELILLALVEALPEAAVDAEEDTASLGRFPDEDGRRPVVIIDPIDGTLNYIRKSREYAVMGALSVEGEYRAAVVYFPDYAAMVWAIAGEGCWRQNEDGPPRRLGLETPPQTVLVTPPVTTAQRKSLAACGLQVRQSRCSAVDSTAPVLGWAQGSVSAKKAGRRRAVGFLLTREAGGVVEYNGRRWQGEDPNALAQAEGPVVVAATQALAARIRECLQRS